MIHRDQITVRRVGDIDPDGYPLDTEELGPYPATVLPLSTDEKSGANYNQTTTRFRLYATHLANLRSTDRVVWRDQTYAVEGAAETWPIAARIHHIEAVLMQVSG